MSPVVAIDGPAGAGKSTVARAVARALGVAHLDTGAMYRAVTHAVLESGADPADPVAAGDAARQAEIDIVEGRVMVGGRDVSEVIRGPEVTAAVSAVSAHPEVRAELVRRQRAWVERRGAGVLEGRDIGTVVLPGADAKIYLTASSRERARRRLAESLSGGDLDTMAAEIERRDRMDSEREHSPLMPADDAVVLDTEGLGADEVVARIVAIVEEQR